MGLRINSIGHTDSDLDISLAEDLNSGLGDYRRSEISKCMYDSRSSMRGMTHLGLRDLERLGGVPKPEPKRRALEPAICLTILN